MNRVLLVLICMILIPLTLSCKDKPSEFKVIEYQIKSKPDFTLKLTDPGREPRKLLKFNFKEGLVENRKMIMDTDIETEMNGTKSPMVYMPSIILPIKSIVEEVKENGTARVKFEINEVSVADDEDANPQLVKSLREQYNKIKNVSCILEVDTFGVGTTPDCEFTGDLGPSIAESVDEMMGNPSSSLFIPEHPVGIGAKWEITNPELKLGGIVFSYKSSHEIVNIEEDTATINTTLVQNADEQMVRFPGAAFETKIEAYSTTGRGSMKIKLDELMPRGKAESESKVTTVIQVGDAPETRVNSNMDMRMEITD